MSKNADLVMILWVFVFLIDLFLQWYVSRVSEACTKGNFEGHLERDRESLAGLPLRGGLEENFDFMYFWII